MPQPETCGLHDKAVLWVKTGTGRHGDPEFASPVEIDCRWESSTTFFRDNAGTIHTITDDVMVDRDIDLESVLWKGKLADIPSPLVELREVAFFDSVSDVKGRHTQRNVRLTKFKGTPP